MRVRTKRDELDACEGNLNLSCRILTRWRQVRRPPLLPYSPVLTWNHYVSTRNSALRESVARASPHDPFLQSQGDQTAQSAVPAFDPFHRRDGRGQGRV